MGIFLGKDRFETYNSGRNLPKFYNLSQINDKCIWLQLMQTVNPIINFFSHSSAEKTMLKKYKSHRAVPDFIFENIDELIK